MRWYHGETLLADTRNNDFVGPNERVHAHLNGTLLLMTVQTDDTGDYTCEVFVDEYQTVKQEHAIEVQCEYGSRNRSIVLFPDSKSIHLCHRPADRSLASERHH